MTQTLPDPPEIRFASCDSPGDLPEDYVADEIDEILDDPERCYEVLLDWIDNERHRAQLDEILRLIATGDDDQKLGCMIREITRAEVWEEACDRVEAEADFQLGEAMVARYLDAQEGY